MSLAGSLGLGKLILYDSNNITIEGDTNIAFEDVKKRFEAYGFKPLWLKMA